MKEIIAYPGDHIDKSILYLSPLCFDNDYNHKEFDFLDLEIDKLKSDLYLNEVDNYINKNLKLIVNITFPGYFNIFPFSFWKRIFYYQIFYTTSLIFKIEKIFDFISNQEILYKIKVLNKNQIYPLENCNIRIINGFNLFKITSLILSKKKFNNIKLIRFSDNYSIEKRKESKFNIFKSLKQFTFYTIQSLLSNVKMGYGINVFDSVILKVMLPHKISEKISINTNLENEIYQESDWRINLISDLISSDFKKILSHYMSLFKTGSMIHDDQIKLVQNTLQGDFKELIISNLGSVNGQIIIPSQHGGDLYYNDDLFKKNFERSYDYFISWIKSRNKNEKNILVLPSPFFSKALDSYNQKDNRVILVGTKTLKFNVGFDGWFINSKEVLIYRDSKIKLINFLITRENKNFFYRPHLSSPQNALPDYNYFLKIFPDLKIIKSNLHNEIRKCKVLILDHPGTTLSLAFSINVPFLLYIKNLKYFGIDNSSPMINEFIKYNILFTDLNKFKLHYDSIIDNPQLWWNSNEIQNIRKLFLDNYAFCDPNWRAKWINELTKI